MATGKNNGFLIASIKKKPKIFVEMKTEHSDHIK